jgi:hypothetical protein
VGTYPVLRINEYLYGDVHSNGHFMPIEPNVINVSGKYAINIKRRGYIEDLKGLEALVLHELCHWGRCRTKTEDGNYEFGDSGDMFRREAYNNPN